MTIKLGDLVKDRITGFEGIATNHQEFISSQVRFTVQPRELKDGQPQKVQTFDESDLKVIKERVFKPTRLAKTKFKLGDFVRDTFFGAEGRINAHVTYLNGCHRWEITQGSLNDKNQIMQHLLMDATLEIVKPSAPLPAAKSGGDHPDISSDMR